MSKRKKPLRPCSREYESGSTADVLARQDRSVVEALESLS
jgi:hypothetical protein